MRQSLVSVLVMAVVTPLALAADDKKPAYKSPEEVHKAYIEFLGKGDMHAAAKLTTKEHAENACFNLIDIVKDAVAADFKTDDKATEAKKKFYAALKELTPKYKLTKDKIDTWGKEFRMMSQKLESQNIKEPEFSQKLNAELTKLVGDPHEFSAAVKEAGQKAGAFRKPDVEGLKLNDVMIDGEKATAKVTKEGQRSGTAVRFRKVGDSWLIDN